MDDLAATAPNQALPAGTRIAEFEVESVLGVGGFGVVYLAFDHALQRRVALKEFLPASLAVRGDEGRICVRSEADAATFALALRSFVNEARLLARFDHPALVKVHRFWEANGTAYMVMPYYEGQTLRASLASLQGAPDETWLRGVLEPLLDALEFLHREQIYHRDVAPDNILLLPHGAPVLLDFGAARHVITGRAQALTAILKPNFAPIEQYGESTLMRQGAWTDLYALGAVLYFCITGRPPNPAASRVLDDELAALKPMQSTLRARDGSAYSEALLGCIDAALSVHPQTRPQSVEDFRAALGGEPPRVQGAMASDAVYPKTIALADSLSSTGDAAAAARGQTGAPATVRRGTARRSGWSWVLQYLGVGLLVVVLTTLLASMDLFESAVVVRRRLAASDLVRAFGNGAGLIIVWLVARRAAAQMRDARGIAARLHGLVFPFVALVILPCAYWVLLPVLRPLLSRSWQTACMWTFITGIVLSAIWLVAMLFERLELLGELGRRAVVRARRRSQADSRSCSTCHTENADRATFCSGCGTALGAMGLGSGR